MIYIYFFLILIMKGIIDMISKGMAFGFGLILIFGIVSLVFAFVEPTSPPGTNYFID